jgi:hypothetical protein
MFVSKSVGQCLILSSSFPALLKHILLRHKTGLSFSMLKEHKGALWDHYTACQLA